MTLSWRGLIGFSILMIVSVNAQQQPLPQRALMVGTKEAPPFSMKEPDGNWIGISIDLWRQIAAELDLTYEFRELDLKQLLDGVKNHSLDVAVAALTITPEREKNFDFTHAYYMTGLGIAVASKARNPWFAVIRRFMSFAFLKILLSLALVLLVVGFLVWWFERKKNPKQFNGNIAKGIGSGFWWSAVTMTTVGYGDKAPITFAGRFAALIWMFVGIILISSFTAAITSSLTVSQLGSMVKGPEDLPRVTVGTIINTTSESYLEQIRISYLPYKTPQEGLIALKKGEIDALVYDAPILRYYIQRDYIGSLHVLPKRLLRQNYGIALTSNSLLREQINVVLLQKIREKAWQDKLFQYLGE
ncbi:MAG: transporter substrate-binding domain-containing protein [Desulfobacterales bacterium]|nr:MAG: transporter substrate-binding domain-containing protein [Desulfobacterales bacterium]